MSLLKKFRKIILFICLEISLYIVIHPNDFDTYISTWIFLYFALALLFNGDLIKDIGNMKDASHIHSMHAYKKSANMTDETYHWKENKEKSKTISNHFFILGGLNLFAYAVYYII